MNSNVSKTITSIVFAAIAVGLLILVFKDVDLQSMWDDITRADFRWIALALFIAMIAYVCRAARWNLLIESTCDHKPTLRNAFWSEMFGYFANLAFPRVGEITRCGALARTEKLPFDTILGTVIVERAFDVLIMFVLMIAVFFIQFDLFGSFIVDKILTPTTSRFSSFSIVTILILLGIAVLILLTFYVLRTKKNVVTDKISSFVKGMIDGVKCVYKLEKRWQFLGYTFLLWFCYWLMTWVVCFSIPQTAHLGMADGLFLLVVGSIGMAVPVQGGIGAFHYIVALALTIYGLDFDSDGLLYATISHESQLIVEIVLGIASLFFVFRKVETRHGTSLHNNN